MNTAQYLKDLGLEPHKKYSPEEIKKAWKKKCQEHHPDKHNGKDEEEKEEHQVRFLEVTHAYKMLTDMEYRTREKLEAGRKKGSPHLDLHVRMQIPMTFEEAFFGGEIAINFARVEVDENHQPIRKDDVEICSVKVDIPPGSLSGHDHTVAGKGLKKGDKNGNVIISFHPNPHPKFRIKEGRHVLTSEKIPLSMLLKGGKKEIQTVYGLKTLNIPAGTAPGARLKIPKCGVNKSGYHYVVVEAQFPTKDELKDESWKGLDINWDIEEEKDEEAEALEREFERIRRHAGAGGFQFVRTTSSTTGGF
jgi:DnaJ-class molecular chaperone